MTTIDYTAPPTCAKFMRSEAFGRLIAGPVGSGKTTACVFELFRRACEQQKAPDGFRHTRFAIVRQTLKQLKDTVLKDILTWLGEITTYKVSDSVIHIEAGDVRSEWLLIPLDDPEDQKRLLSMQLTGAWMSECIEMDIGLVSPLAGRVGRYPSAAMGGCTWMGIIADTNMPTEGGDWHKFMTLKKPPDWDIYIQPGGLEENAENLDYLTQTPITLKLPVGHPVRKQQGRTYYERFIRSNTPDWCTRFVHAKFGPDPSGQAVYRDSFKYSFHVIEDIEPIYGFPLLIGQDFGRDPWSLICQPDHKGRLLVLEEIEAEGIGLELHIDRNLRPVLMQERYLGRAILLVGDPSGTAKNNHYEETSYDLLTRKGLLAFPAPTNDLDPRIRAVEQCFTRALDGGPGILISAKRCPKLVLGLSGNYRYSKTRNGQRKPVPDKNEWSHVNDDLQYVAMAFNSGMLATHGARVLAGRRTPTVRQPIPSGAWT